MLGCQTKNNKCQTECTALNRDKLNTTMPHAQYYISKLLFNVDPHHFFQQMSATPHTSCDIICIQSCSMYVSPCVLCHPNSWLCLYSVVYHAGSCWMLPPHPSPDSPSQQWRSSVRNMVNLAETSRQKFILKYSQSMCTTSTQTNITT